MSLSVSSAQYLKNQPHIAQLLRQAYATSTSKSIVGSRFKSISNCNTALVAVSFQLLGRIAYVFETILLSLNPGENINVGKARFFEAVSDCKAPAELWLKLFAKPLTAFIKPDTAFNEFQNLAPNLIECDNDIQKSLLLLTAETEKRQLIEQLTQRSTQLNTEIIALGADLEKNEKQRAIRQEELKNIEAQCKIEQNKLDKIKIDQEIEVTNFTKKKRELGNEIVGLKQKSNELKKNVAEDQQSLTKIEKVLEQLREEKQKLERDLITTKAKLDDKFKEFTNSENQQAIALENLEKQISGQKKYLELARSQKVQFEETLKQTEQKLRKIEEESKKLSSISEVTKKEIEQFEAKKQALDNEKIRLTSELQTIKIQLETQRGDKQKIEKEIVDLDVLKKQKLNELEGHKKEKENEFIKLEENCDELKKKAKQLDDKIKEKNSKYNKLEAEYEELKKKLEKIKREADSSDMNSSRTPKVSTGSNSGNTSPTKITKPQDSNVNSPRTPKVSTGSNSSNTSPIKMTKSQDSTSKEVKEENEVDSSSDEAITLNDSKSKSSLKKITRGVSRLISNKKQDDTKKQGDN